MIEKKTEKISLIGYPSFYPKKGSKTLLISKCYLSKNAEKF